MWRLPVSWSSRISATRVDPGDGMVEGSTSGRGDLSYDRLADRRYGDGEVFLDTTHPAPTSGQKVTESPAGTDKVGPIRFDKAGQWTVRWHLFEQCDDTIGNSPHGHAAFYVAVP